jgi:hypothetical protein
MTPMQQFANDIEKYIRWRDDQIQHCRVLIEEQMKMDKIDLLTKANEQPNIETGKLWYHLEHTLGNTFRYTLLLGVCSTLEETLKSIAEKIFPDKEEGKRQLRQAEKEIRQEIGYQNWLRSYTRMICKRLQIIETERFETDVSQFSDIITIRNCIIHSWGKIEASEFINQTRQTVERLAEIGKEQNCDMVDISRDGYLALGDKIVAHAQCLTVPIVDFLCDGMK